MATKPNFDPVAMGLEPIYQGGQAAVYGDAEQAGSLGTQTGWYKYLGDRKQQQYDMDGNPTRIFENPGLGEQTLDLGKKVAPLALAAVTMGGLAGAGPLGGMLGGGGAATGAGTLSAGGMGGLGDLTALSGVGESFIPAAQAFETGFAGTAAITDAGVSASGFASSGLGSSLSSIGAVDGTASVLAPTAATVGQGATLAMPSVAGTGAMGAGLGGAATDVAGGDALAAYTSIGISPEVVAANPGVTSMIQSTFGDVATWVKANPELAKIMFSGVVGLAGAAAAKSASDAVNQNKLDQINLVQQNKLDDNKRFSESVSGLKKPGLIAQGPLKRNDGSRVFSGNGLINRG